MKKLKKIDLSQAKWFGTPGHFCCSNMCRFHLCTVVNNYVVSTVGEYYSSPNSKNMETIGWNRKYETMVFKVRKDLNLCGCGCGMPVFDYSELDLLAWSQKAPLALAKGMNDDHIKETKIKQHFS